MQSARQAFDKKILAVIVTLSILFLGWMVVGAVVKMWLPVTVQFTETTIAAKVARSDQARERGLAQSDSLAEGTGMLFVFDEESRWGIWMKDMKYPIDIIWINNKKEVVHIVHQATPDSYPRKTFKPKEMARYVLEVPAGVAKKHSIGVGDKAEFEV